MVEPNVVDIAEIERIASTSYSRFSTPMLNIKIHGVLQAAHLDPNDIKKELEGVKDINDVIRVAMRQIINQNTVNFDAEWYRLLKRKINQYYYRYTRLSTKLIHSTNHSYRTLFSLYIYLILEYDIDLMSDELDYFISAQYSSRYHKDKGFLTVKAEMFNYKGAYADYRLFKSKHMPPTLLNPPVQFIYYTEPLDRKTIGEISRLKDDEFAPYGDYVLPILKGRIPSLKGVREEILRRYIQNLEFLILREVLICRPFNKFVLSIEHIRSYTHLIRNYT